ncbi:hypothetical protein D3C87_1304130 [compost metagenome]
MRAKFSRISSRATRCTTLLAQPSGSLRLTPGFLLLVPVKSNSQGLAIAATVSNRPMKLMVTSVLRRQLKLLDKAGEPAGSAFAKMLWSLLSTSLAKCRAAAAPRLKPKISNSIRSMISSGFRTFSWRICSTISVGLCSTRATTPVSPRPVISEKGASLYPLMVPIPSL